MKLDWNGWVKHVQSLCTVVYKVVLSSKLHTSGKLYSRNCGGLSPLPALLTASQLRPLFSLAGWSLPPRLVWTCCTSWFERGLQWRLQSLTKFYQRFGLTEGPCRKDHWWADTKFRDLDGKGWLWPHPVTPSLTAFSRLQQEEPRTLSPHLPVATTASAGPQPLWMLPGAICWMSALVFFLI